MHARASFRLASLGSSLRSSHLFNTPVSIRSPTSLSFPSFPIKNLGQTRSLFIKVETTPNPDSIKFIPEGKQVLPEELGNGLHFDSNSKKLATGSPLVTKLLKYKEITGVFLGREFISVNKTEETSWGPLKPIILNAMMDAFAEAEQTKSFIIDPSKASKSTDDNTKINDDDDEVVAMIKELLETRIRPAVQEDGGDIFYMGFDESSGIVKLKMAGSCVGCPSSTATLRNGVENMLMHYIPEVKGIEQVKDELTTQGEDELKTMEERLKAAGAQV
jgi:NFU1 iron-sulfur cluster scaffold homolog, mitochondrial